MKQSAFKPKFITFFFLICYSFIVVKYAHFSSGKSPSTAQRAVTGRGSIFKWYAPEVKLLDMLVYVLKLLPHLIENGPLMDICSGYAALDSIYPSPLIVAIDWFLN